MTITANAENIAPLTDEELEAITDREDIADNLNMGMAPSDWLVATGPEGPSEETRRWAMNHAEARTEEVVPPVELVQYVLAILKDMKAEDIAEATDEIEGLIAALGGHVNEVKFTSESVLILTDLDEAVLNWDVVRPILGSVREICETHRAGSLRAGLAAA